MSDYIKREDAKDAVINVVGWESIAKYVDELSKHFSTKDNEYYDALMDAEDAIDDLPSEDVAPIRYGHWIEDQDRIVCSECGARFKDEIIYMQENKPGVPHRCLECGAIMDQEVNDGQDDGDR